MITLLECLHTFKSDFWNFLNYILSTLQSSLWWYELWRPFSNKTKKTVLILCQDIMIFLSSVVGMDSKLTWYTHSCILEREEAKGLWLINFYSQIKLKSIVRNHLLKKFFVYEKFLKDIMVFICKKIIFRVMNYVAQYLKYSIKLLYNGKYLYLIYFLS